MKVGRPSRLICAAALLLLGTLATFPAWVDDMRTVTVTATEFAFEPSRIEVDSGEPVRIRLRNEGALSHNIHIRGAEAHTRTVQAGSTSTVTVTPSDTGTLEFFCKVPGHEQAGMVGTLVVE